ncbi:allatotropin-like isoform X1 [Leptidea sinapis]|uniref:allatotropin-like isoform X1 n=1 Tax=Leptidea sinapis TaxID=189913 RepID=UPI002141C6C1|nr:allatotropin-like isoform X1 [Leptidea sinapis]
MNVTMQLAVMVAVCLCLAEAAPVGRLTRSKQQRPTRGFKNVEMMTARGFGKRARTERDVVHQRTSERTSRGIPIFKSPSVGIARDFGKRTPELESEDESRKTFKPRCMHLMTAKDFGKRSDNNDVNDEEEEIRVTRGTFKPNSNVLIARGYGKRQGENGEVYGMDNFWESLEGTQEKDGQETDEKPVESIPMDWFVNEMLNNPDFARSVVRKFVDQNQDGILSADELLRNTA